MKTAPKKRRNIAHSNGTPDSFVYRGVRITRTWANSKRRKEIGEAMQKVMQRGPGQAPTS